jgi:hypothetical protein
MILPRLGAFSGGTFRDHPEKPQLWDTSETAGRFRNRCKALLEREGLWMLYTSLAPENGGGGCSPHMQHSGALLQHVLCFVLSLHCAYTSIRANWGPKCKHIFHWGSQKVQRNEPLMNKFSSSVLSLPRQAPGRIKGNR